MITFDVKISLFTENLATELFTVVVSYTTIINHVKTLDRLKKTLEHTTRETFVKKIWKQSWGGLPPTNLLSVLKHQNSKMFSNYDLPLPQCENRKVNQEICELVEATRGSEIGNGKGCSLRLLGTPNKFCSLSIFI